MDHSVAASSFPFQFYPPAIFHHRSWCVCLVGGSRRAAGGNGPCQCVMCVCVCVHGQLSTPLPRTGQQQQQQLAQSMLQLWTAICRSQWYGSPMGTFTLMRWKFRWKILYIKNFSLFQSIMETTFNAMGDCQPSERMERLVAASLTRSLLM